MPARNIRRGSPNFAQKEDPPATYKLAPGKVTELVLNEDASVKLPETGSLTAVATGVSGKVLTLVPEGTDTVATGADKVTVGTSRTLTRSSGGEWAEPAPSASGGTAGAFLASDDGANVWNNFAAAHVKHIYINGGVAWNGVDGQALWNISGGKWQNLTMISGDGQTITFYYETSNDGDNQPQWTLETDLTTLGAGDYTLISVYHFDGTLWLVQDGVICTPTGTWGSGQNADGAVAEADHYSGVGLPGAAAGTFNIYDGIGTDSVFWATNNVPDVTASAIAADAAAALASWRITTR